MARYGTLIAWADELGHDDVVRLLTTNLTQRREPPGGELKQMRLT